MKRRLTIGGVALLLVIGWWWLNGDRLFADVYYAKVPSPGTSEQSKIYTYEVIGYGEEGKKRPLTIKAPERLSEGDFLKVYVKGEQQVTAYEPVTESEVPAQLKKEQTEEPILVTLP